MSLFTSDQRRAGILLHPTSLPSGNLADALQWLDFLQASGCAVWQMLPLGVPLAGLSPYQCASAFAVNPVLFPKARGDMRGFSRWCRAQKHWLDDYARFMVIKQLQDGACWVDWPAPLRQREPNALSDFDRLHEAALIAVMTGQYCAWSHWKGIRQAAIARGISLFGDMPIFVAHDSADVWAHPERFLLDDAGRPTVVAGVPPDYFSATGQRWGNPHYNWAVMREEGFSWWLERLRYHFEWFDLLRIDHFRGLAAAWTIPASEDTAVNGSWQPVPGAELLQKLKDEMGDIPLVAEDLGIITADVTALRRDFDLPGMAVLQFAFDAHADNPHKPENVGHDTVYYTGTHDNDTTLGWFSSLPADVQHQIRQQLNAADANQVLDAMQHTVLASQAALAILPMQDVLRLGSFARMNTPGTTEGNWRWRFQWDMLEPELASCLLEQLEKTARCETKNPS
ncbi:MAG: 4-alpha-glucanotransferase [Thiobacillaceae bacterium]